VASPKDVDNIRWATKDMKISYPVAVDSEHLIWRGFRNQYWPALYFIDTQGVWSWRIAYLWRGSRLVIALR